MYHDLWKEYRQAVLDLTKFDTSQSQILTYHLTKGSTGYSQIMSWIIDDISSVQNHQTDSTVNVGSLHGATEAVYDMMQDNIKTLREKLDVMKVSIMFEFDNNLSMHQWNQPNAQPTNHACSFILRVILHSSHIHEWLQNIPSQASHHRAKLASVLSHICRDSRMCEEGYVLNWLSL